MTLRALQVDAVTFDFYQTLVHHRAGRGRGAALMEYLSQRALESDPWEHQVLYDVFEPHGREYRPLEPEAERRRYYRRLASRVFARLNVRASPGEAELHAENLWGILGPESLAVFEDVPEVLSALRGAGYALAVVSNWQCGLAHFCTELGLRDAFHHVVASAEVGSAKPAPAIFHEACRRLGVPTHRVLHVGDSAVDDVEGGMGAGLHVVRVARRPGERKAGAATVDAPTIPSLRPLLELPSHEP